MTHKADSRCKVRISAQ